MRTTMNIDDEVLEAARVLAAERKVSVGTVISDLALKGLFQTTKDPGRNKGFPVFDVSPASTPLTLERIKSFEEDI